MTDKQVEIMNMHFTIIFDGVCNLCEWFILFVIRHDIRQRFFFTQFQSEYSGNLLSRHRISEIAPGTVILLADERVYIRSAAVLEILKILGGYWRIFYIFKLIPRFIRDSIYDFVAANRYKWFGKKQQCMIPDENIRMRFLS